MTDTAIENRVFKGFDLQSAPADATHYDTKLRSWIKIEVAAQGNNYHWYNQHGWQPLANCDRELERFVEIRRFGEPTQQPAEKKPSMAELYPKYFRDVRHLDEMDVYAVHHVFTINDPSGCLQHASKKILLSGTRNGGKSLAQDIKEARDTLTRKLQLMGVE